MALVTLAWNKVKALRELLIDRNGEIGRVRDALGESEQRRRDTEALLAELEVSQLFFFFWLCGYFGLGIGDPYCPCASCVEMFGLQSKMVAMGEREVQCRRAQSECNLTIAQVKRSLSPPFTIHSLSFVTGPGRGRR